MDIHVPSNTIPSRTDDFLELLEQIRREVPPPSGTAPGAGQLHYQAVIYSYLQDLLM